MIGAQQASPVIAEALAIRELGIDLSNRSSCSKVVGQLTRGPGDASQIGEVELAWRAIDTAAGKIATSYVRLISAPPRPESHATTDDAQSDLLTAALVDMDAAHARLRAGAGMPPLPPRATTPLPTATTIALEVGGEPLAIAQHVAITNGAIIGTATTGKRAAMLVLPTGKPPMIMETAGAHRSLPDLDWGLVGTKHELGAGPLDAAGAITKTAKLRVPGTVRPLFALGNATRAAVAATLDDERHGVRVLLGESRAGKLDHWTHTFVDDVRHCADASGRGVVVWHRTDGEREAAVLSTTSARDQLGASTFALGKGPLAPSDRTCLTARRAYATANGTLYAFGEPGVKPVAHALPDHTLIGCSTDAVLLRRSVGTKLTACDDACRTVELPNAHPSSIGVLAGTRILAIAARRRVIGVWSEAGAKYYATAAPFTPMYATSDGTVIDILGRAPTGLAIARLPVP
jgi:hypothetical protein